tara:strand:+ start:63 stop:1331 length:1269 start_codon:yes stop_codon:yes gene_type:complete
MAIHFRHFFTPTEIKAPFALFSRISDLSNGISMEGWKVPFDTYYIFPLDVHGLSQLLEVNSELDELAVLGLDSQFLNGAKVANVICDLLNQDILYIQYIEELSEGFYWVKPDSSTIFHWQDPDLEIEKDPDFRIAAKTRIGNQRISAATPAHLHDSIIKEGSAFSSQFFDFSAKVLKQFYTYIEKPASALEDLDSALLLENQSFRFPTDPFTAIISEESGQAFDDFLEGLPKSDRKPIAMWKQPRSIFSRDLLVHATQAIVRQLGPETGAALVRAFIERPEINKKAHFGEALAFASSRANIPWIENLLSTSGESLRPGDWAAAIAFSKPDWETMNSWLSRGRPFIFLALETLQFFLQNRLSMKFTPPPDLRKLFEEAPPRLQRPPKRSIIDNALKAALSRDGSPRIRQSVEQVLIHTNMLSK